jgi:mRNA interferase YafQ
MLKVLLTSAYKRQVKKYKHNKKVTEELITVISLLINEKPIPEKYKNHKLIGDQNGLMELHLRPDDLLIYFKIEKESITLVAIGSHADLFG